MIKITEYINTTDQIKQWIVENKPEKVALIENHILVNNICRIWTSEYLYPEFYLVTFEGEIVIARDIEKYSFNEGLILINNDLVINLKPQEELQEFKKVNQQKYTSLLSSKTNPHIELSIMDTCIILRYRSGDNIAISLDNISYSQEYNILLIGNIIGLNLNE